MPGPVRRRILRAYVDETGDRGSSGKSSDFFAFACALIADEDEDPLRAAVSQLRRDLKVPVGKALHWKDHVKTFSRRQHVTSLLTAVPNMRLIYVLVDKSAIPASASMRSDQAIFYNFAAAFILERALLAAKYWSKGSRDLVLRFSQVRGFNHALTNYYFDLRIATDNPPWMPWHLLSGRARFSDQGSWDGLQAADQFAGMLSAAIRQDQYGNYEPHHLIRAAPLIRRESGRAWRYGFKLLGDNRATVLAFPWWTATDL